jgi:hypothetical protein
MPALGPAAALQMRIQLIDLMRFISSERNCEPRRAFPLHRSKEGVKWPPQTESKARPGGAADPRSPRAPASTETDKGDAMFTQESIYKYALTTTAVAAMVATVILLLLALRGSQIFW